MSSLTGNQIQNTYQGLLKLADSSTGITQNLQAVQDGLGNNTGLRLAQGQLEVPNIPTFVNLKSEYYGIGYTNSAPSQIANGTQNIILAVPFYDLGHYSYSALTINIVNATSTSDTLELAFYTSQLISPNGLYPHTPVLSGLTADTTTTGEQTITLPSALSFSGYGGGVYWLVYKISNSGVQPTVRWGGVLNHYTQGQLSTASQSYGVARSLTGLSWGINAFRPNTNYFAFSGTTTFDNPFASNLDTTQSTTSNLMGTNLGFILHTI